MAKKPPVKYEFRGELLTAAKIRDKYHLPERLVWKAFNDPKKPSLEQMIVWRMKNGIDDVNDYRCMSIDKPIKCKAKDKPIKEEVKDSVPNNEVKCLSTGSLFGVYEVIGRYKFKKTSRINVACTECGKIHYDLPFATFTSRCETKCSCDKFTKIHIVRNLPVSLQLKSVSTTRKDLSYYKEFIGAKIGGIRISGISVKQTNDKEVYIFSGECPVCHCNFTVSGFDIITGRFSHKCSCRKKKSHRKNSGCVCDRPFNTNCCHIHRDMSEQNFELIRNHIGFYSLNAGTEAFMNMCLDLELTGNKEHFEQIHGMYA